MGQYTEHSLVRDIKRRVRKSHPEYVCQHNVHLRDVDFSKKHSPEKVVATLGLGMLLVNVQKLRKRNRMAEIKRMLNKILSATPDIPQIDEFIESMRLRVRTQFCLNLTSKVLSEKRDQPTDRMTINRGDLLGEIVSDQAHSIRMVTSLDLSNVGMTLKEAGRVASANLVRLTDGNQWREIESGIWLSTYQDDYDFARVVAAGNDARFPFDSHPLIYVPSHSICLITDRTDADLLDKITKIGYKLSSDHKPFSLLFWSMNVDGNWNRWAPEVESNSRPIADRQCLHERAFEYARQQMYLKDVLGNNVFIATFNLASKNKKHFSTCVYSFDLHSYLPVTDFVGVVDPALPPGKAVLGMMPWASFKSCLGDNLQSVADDFFLPYFKTTEDLSPAQKDTLRSQATMKIDLDKDTQTK